MHQAYSARWSEALAGGRTPKYLRSVVRIPYPEFRDKVHGSEKFAREFVESAHGGDFWIVENGFSRQQVELIRESTIAFRGSQPPSNVKVVEGCPNFHCIVDGSTAPKGGYVAIDHSSYLYRWNGDQFKLFETLDEAWKLLKVISGRHPDEYAANTPKDLLVDRIQIIQYPHGVGQISPHGDPYVAMKVNLGVFLSTHGVDFKEGGFFISDRPNHPVLLDPQMKAGDIPIWFSHMVHGVATIDPGRKVDWSANDGRWYVHLNTVESAYVEKRHTGVPLQ